MKKLPIILALDLEDKNQVLELVKKTQSHLSGYKIGPRLFLKEGLGLLQEIQTQASQCKIFLDFKFYDIPSSTVSAVRSAFEIGANYVTVHARLKLETLRQLYELELAVNAMAQKDATAKTPIEIPAKNPAKTPVEIPAKSSSQKPRFLDPQNFRVLCVTVLSSEKESKETKTQVLALADKVYQSGLRSLVCSAREAQALKKKYPDLFLVTPGIRLAGDSLGDQKRVMTAKQALQAGSSALVMGRSLTQCAQLDQRLKELSKELLGAQHASA